MNTRDDDREIYYPPGVGPKPMSDRPAQPPRIQPRRDPLSANPTPMPPELKALARRARTRPRLTALDVARSGPERLERLRNRIDGTPHSRPQEPPRSPVPARPRRMTSAAPTTPSKTPAATRVPGQGPAPR